MHYSNIKIVVCLSPQVVELSEGDDFEAAKVSIGLFGVITEVTLRVRDKYNLRELRTHDTLTNCIENIFTLSNSSEYQYVKFWVEFYNNFCIKYQTKVTEEPIRDNPGKVISFLTVSISMYTVRRDTYSYLF